MCAMRKDPSVIRLARFESFEPRVLLSADTTGELIADFVIDYGIDCSAANQDLQTALADAHSLTGLTEAYNAYGLDGSGQTVVVIDTGVAYDHLALGGGLGADYRVVGGFDFTAERDSDPYDDGPLGSHGTHVAGIIASSDSYNPGVAPGVDIVALRVFDDEGQGTFEWVEEALAWVHENINTFENPITTVNLSLGVVYNSDSIPSWATLENELAQLEDDGIFISVAAGNKFTSYNDTGLSYPAVSEHVVPVASLDSDGSLSFYSQRNERVIAAPGRSITSTVPDYVGNDNGIDDDFATYSGTSMASPYVAGASILIRQAFEFVGVTGVTQDMIYDLMCSTADTVYDSITNASYYSLNISQALDVIMGDDDYGSSQASAYDLGSIADTYSLDGTVGRLDDVDWFSFTADASGIISLAVDATHDFDVDWSYSDSVGNVSIIDGVLSFEVTAGLSYAVGLGTGDGIGHYTLDAALETIGGNPGDGSGEGSGSEGGSSAGNNWGSITQNTFENQQISSVGRWYSFTATADGILTVEALFDHSDGDIDIELYDAEGRLLSGSYGLADTERIDVAAQAGEQFLLRAVNVDPGVNEAVDFRVTNLVALQGDALVVAGSATDDIVNFSAGSTYSLTVNGVVYNFSGSRINRVVLDGAGGNDSVTISGTGGNASLAVGSATFQSDGFTAAATNFENVTLDAGSSGGMAVIYDSAGDDTFIAGPQESTLSGEGFSLRAVGFSSVLASATAGGNDTASISDSAGNDTFLATPTYSRLRGDGFYIRVKGFENVRIEASAGGYDRAYLFDSAGNDTLVASPNATTLSGSSFCICVDAFEYVSVRAAAGVDTAIFQTPTDAEFTSASSYAFLSGNNYAVRADAFDHIHTQSPATAAAGEDDLAANVSPESEPLDHILTQTSLAKLYSFEFAREQNRRLQTDDDETQALDHVLDTLTYWT